MRLILVTATVLITAATAQSNVFIFDFGTQDSPLHPGAIRVTEKGGDHATWRTGTTCTARARPIITEWIKDAHTAKTDPPPVYLDDLTCDYVCSAETNVLTLDIPRGPYRLILLCGRAGGRTEQVWDLSINDPAATHTFAGPNELRTLQFDETANAEGLAITFYTRSRWLVNALIAVPADEWENAHKNVIAPILNACSTLPPEEFKKWKETPHLSADPEPQWTEQQKRNGLAVFTRPWVEPIWPHDFPRQHELDAPVRAFASPGEYEPLTFALYPRANFSNVNVCVARELVCTTGVKRAAIAAADIDLRVVQFMNVRPNYSAFNTYYRAPDVLMPWLPQPLIKGENLRLWLTVHVGPRQPAGLYTGEVRVTADMLTLSVPITLRVLPIPLLKDPSLVYGQYYRHPLRHIDNTPDNFSRAWWQHKAESEHADMREHGMNTVVLGLGGSWKENRWVYAFDRLQRDIDLYRSVGFDKPIVCSFPFGSLYHKYMKADMGSHLSQIKMPPDAFFDELTAMVRTIESEARRRQWPELLYYPVDEPSTSPDSVAFMTRVMAAIKQAPKVRTYVTADPEQEMFAPLRPFIDIWCCQPFSLGRAAVLADMKARGVEYWCYPNHISGENDHTTTQGARMTYGFGFWQSGYRSLIPWIYQYDCGDPWNYLDSSSQDFFNRTADDGSPIPVTLWEADREGIDDHRYLFTLENMITRAESAGLKDAAAHARAVIAQLTASIVVQPKYKTENLWSAEAFNAWRWALAEQILALQVLLDK